MTAARERHETLIGDWPEHDQPYEDPYSALDFRLDLARVLDALEFEVVAARYGLDAPAEPLSRVAAALKLTLAQVDDILASALAKLARELYPDLMATEAA